MWIHSLPYFFSVPITPQNYHGDVLHYLHSLNAWTGSTINPLELSSCVTASVIHSRQYRNLYLLSIAYDHLVLGLGPDLPWVDEPSPGNLRLSMGRILTSLSLLMPAFSLLCSPPLLSVRLLPAYDAPLPLLYAYQHLFGFLFLVFARLRRGIFLSSQKNIGRHTRIHSFGGRF